MTDETDPIVEVVVETTNDGMAIETTTTTVTVTKPSAEMIQVYDDQIANLRGGIQNNLDQIDFFNSEIARIEALKQDAIT